MANPTIGDLQNAVVDLRAQLATVLAQIAIMTASVAACADCAHVVNRVTALEAQVATLQAQIVALEAQIAALGSVVTPPPPPPTPQTIDTFSADNLSLIVGGAVTFTWSTSNATAVRLNGVAVGVSGSRRFTPTVDTTYTLAADGAVATVSSSLTATVAVVAPPPPPINAPRIQLAYPYTNWTSANKTLHGGADTVGPDAWVVPGGDYLDANGVLNGPTASRTVTVTAGVPFNVSIAGIDGDLRLSGVRISSVTIDGVLAQGFWTDATSGFGVALPNATGRAAMILNPMRGTTLTVTPATGGTATINHAVGPIIDNLPYVGGSATPNIWELPLTDETSLLAFIGAGHYAVPYAFNPQFLTDPDNGMKYFRFTNGTFDATDHTGQYSRLISWKPGLGAVSGGSPLFTARADVRARWCLYIEDDVATGFNELGMKLPGLANDDAVGQTELVSSRTEHSPPGPANGGLYGFLTYDYSVESGAGFGVITNANALLRAGRWYVFEQRLVMNTPGVADGTYQLWVNGHLTLNRSNAEFRADVATMPTILHINVYHGGLGSPKGPLTYRLARVGVSTAYMGIPPELAPTTSTTTLPTFVPAVGAIANISLNTMADVNPCPANTCSYSGVTKQGSVYNDTGVVYAPKLGALGSIICTGGGHNDYYGSEVYRYDIATQLWSRITNPHDVLQATSPPLAVGDASIGYHSICSVGNQWGEQWTNSSFASTLANQPSASHLYGFQVIVPIGAKDTLLTLCRPALTPIGSNHGRGAHILDLDAQVTAGPSTSLWQRVSPNLNPSFVPAYGGAVYDARRNRVYGTQSTGTAGTMYYLDMTSRTWTMTGIDNAAFYGTLMRSEAADRMIYFRLFNGGYTFKVIDPNTGTVRQPTVIGALPPYDAANAPLGGGSDWCVDLPGTPGFVYLNGGGEKTAYLCRPGANFDTDPWTFTAQTLTPVTPADNPVIQFSPSQCTHLHRFVYVPPLRSFLWFATVGAPVNCWRLFA